VYVRSIISQYFMTKVGHKVCFQNATQSGK
jgi:hypothetical protein